MSVTTPSRLQQLEDELARLTAELARERASSAANRGSAEMHRTHDAIALASETARADRAQEEFDALTVIHDQFVSDTSFMRDVLEVSSDFIKVLDMDGRLLFMSAGGQRVMEVDDFSTIAGCPWPDFWTGAGRSDVEEALASARVGRSSQFVGKANTAKGRPRWWEVSVTPMPSASGGKIRILSISRDITARMEAEEQKELLANELQHRVQNLLSVAAAITQQTLRGSNEVNEASAKIANRLGALSTAHRLLSKGSSLSTRLVDVVAEALKPYDEAGRRIVVSGEDHPLGRNAAIALTLTINELCTNAIKYGALSNSDGHISLDWESDGELLRLTWREAGGPPVSPATRTGFGSRVIRSNIESAMGGKIVTNFKPEGLLQILEMPLSALRE
jgi:PAS domain S-box-containing protein